MTKPEPPTDAGTYRLVGPRGVGYAVEGLRSSYLGRLIDFPELPLRTGAWQAIKQGRSAQLVRLNLPLDGQDVPVAYKRIRRQGWQKIVSDFVRTHRALRAWRFGHELLKQGVSTARPLAVVIPGRFADADAFLATEWIEGAESLHHFAMRMQKLGSRDRHIRLKAAAARLGELLGRLHHRNVTHRDLKAANLLIREEPPQTEAYVIDLDGVAIKWHLSSELRMRNLARLDVSLDPHACIGKTARLRFLHSYLAASQRPAETWKTVWRGIAQHSLTLRHRKRNSSPSSATPSSASPATTET